MKRHIRNAVRALQFYPRLLFDPRQKVFILVYHRVLPQFYKDPWGTVISEKTFSKQIDCLAQRYPIVSLNEVLSQRESPSRRDSIQVVLTFDDGYWDSYETVFPLLCRKGIPATFLVVSHYINQNKPLWDLEIFHLMLQSPTFRRLKIQDRMISKKPYESRLSFFLRIFQMIKFMSFNQREQIMKGLKDQVGTHLDLQEKCMTWDQLKKMSEAGMEIGSHGMTHGSLGQLSTGEAFTEIRQSKLSIEEKLNKNCLHFAFPYGGKKDFNLGLIRYVKEVGYQSCLLNIRGYNHLEREDFCFKRIIMGESTPIKYLLG